MQVNEVINTTGASQLEIAAVQKLLDVHELLNKLVHEKGLSDNDFRKVDGLVHQTEDDKLQGIIDLDHFTEDDGDLIESLIEENGYYFKNIHAEVPDRMNTINLLDMIITLDWYFKG